MYTTVVLIERELSAADVAELVGLHGEEDDRFFVLVPAAEERGIVRMLDDLALGEFHEAAEDVEDDVQTAREARATHHAGRGAHRADPGEPAAGPVPPPASGAAEPAEQQALAASVEALRAAGASADGAVGGGLGHADVLAALTETVRRVEADEVIVMTRPHLVEEFFHRDWASRARRATGLPVLKLIAHHEDD